jgi:hypothetical protein
VNARALVLFAVVLPAAASALPDPATRVYREPLAVVLDSTGEVGWTPAFDRSPARPVGRLQALDEGARLHLPAGSRIRLFCSAGTYLELDRDAVLTAELCRGGRPLPGDSAALLRPQAGRLRTVGRSLELVGDLRGELGDAPVLLFPRNTRVLDGRPALGWTEVDGAAAYEVRLTGGGLREIAHLPAGKVWCGVQQRAGLTLRTCGLAWPAEWPELPAGTDFQLAVRAVRSTGPWLDLQEVSRLQVLPPAEAEGLRTRLCEIAGLEIDPLTRLLLLAGTAAGAGLLAEAATAYEEAAARTGPAGAPEIAATLGEVYRAAGLYELAAAAYRRAQGAGAGTPAHAAAQLGLARLSAARNDKAAAREGFERAQRELEQLGLADEAGEAARELARLGAGDGG